jgi:hypothetical protein
MAESYAPHGADATGEQQMSERTDRIEWDSVRIYLPGRRGIRSWLRWAWVRMKGKPISYAEWLEGWR